jgi:hypothetical protein
LNLKIPSRSKIYEFLNFLFTFRKILGIVPPVIDKLHLLILPSRPTGARDARSTVATAERASRAYREDHHQSGGNRAAGRTAHFSKNGTARQLAEDDRGHANAERRVARDRRGAVPRQVISDAMRPQRRSSANFPISTFIALHIAQEALPDSGIHLDPALYDHPGPGL